MANYEKTDSFFQRRVAGLSMGIGVTALALFGITLLVGVIARTSQGGFITFSPDVFYAFMTLHSVGAIGAVMTGMIAMMWYSLRKYLNLNMGLMKAMFGLVLLAVVGILTATLVGRYGTGWTFLYPLTFKSAGAWSDWAAGLFLISLLLVGVAMIISWGDVVVSAARMYGFTSAVGWMLISGADTTETAPPPVVIISTITSLCGLISLVAGATAITLQLIHWIDSSFYIDPLLIKNLIYFFGHIVMNMSMYMAAAVVYEILPQYAGRPWKSNKIVAISWNSAFIAVTLAYWHHLLQDFAQPLAFQVIGVFGSYMAAFPSTAVTIIGALILVYRSGIKWTAVPLYIYLGLMAWAIGGFAAIIDGGFNNTFHNTMFVPGHFHLYLLGGVAFIFAGTLYHIVGEHGGVKELARDRFMLWTWFIGAYGVVATFMISGIFGAPRRYAVQMPGKEIYSTIAVFFAWTVAVAVILVIGRIGGHLIRLQRVKA